MKRDLDAYSVIDTGFYGLSEDCADAIENLTEVE